MAYDNTNTGILTKNDRKEQDNHPDYTGTINVHGTEFWLSAWIKTGRSGKLEGQKFMSLSVRPKEEKRAAPSKPAPRRQVEDAGDDIPF